MATQAALGLTALNANNYPEAIKQYTAALRLNPESPDYYIKRATAYQRATPPDYEAALSDAEIGVAAATKRARRELIVQAQLRRAMALFGLERYGDAKFVFDIVKEMDPKEKQIAIWDEKVKSKLKELDAGDPKSEVTVEKVPTVQIPLPEKEIKQPIQSASNTESTAPTTKALSIPEQTPPSKIKHDWYQNQSKVFLSLLAKGVPQDKTMVDIQERSVSISFPTGLGTTFDFSLDPLFEPVDPSTSTYRITASKIEVTLAKASPKKWAALESTDPAVITAKKSNESAVDTAMKNVVLGDLEPPVGDKPPNYPTSSKGGPKNWDKVASEFDDKEGDDINNFFQSLYAGADPDVKRAMIKSYQESNGTVLSTNWAEVGQGKVETSPPDGMVARKWDD
jgi:suppressor of G2 allele of SKP1